MIRLPVTILFLSYQALSGEYHSMRSAVLWPRPVHDACMKGTAGSPKGGGTTLAPRAMRVTGSIGTISRPRPQY